MKIGKYDISSGSGTKPNTGTTAVAGSVPTIDLTPLTDKVAALENEVSNLKLALSRMSTALNGLDAKYLSKFGDSSIYTYMLGAVYTDYIQSEMYDNGVGYRISGNPTATVDDKYNLVIRDVGWGTVGWNTVQQSEVTYVDENTDEATDQLIATNVSIGATNADGYMLLDCGATLTNERYFTVISKSVTYRVQATIGQQIHISDTMEAGTDNNGNFILFFSKADNIRFTITFRFTYAFRKANQYASGTYRLYIRGTDPSNNRTDCFGAADKTTKINASGFSVMQGDNGYRITSAGLEVTTDGGTTWTSVGTGGSASFGNSHDLVI